MKKKYFIPACVLLAVAIGFFIFALGHPEMSFPWNTQITHIFYGLYVDAVHAHRFTGGEIQLVSASGTGAELHCTFPERSPTEETSFTSRKTAERIPSEK